MEKINTFNRVVAVGVDIQNDFCPGGSLGVNEGDLIVEPFNQTTDWVRENNGIVAFTRDWHPKVTNHFVEYGGPWPPHCVAGTFGAEFKQGLDIRDGDPVMSKGTRKDEDAYSGFQGKATNGLTLEALISPVRHERVAVVIGGLATDYCVKATVLDALAVAEKAKAQGLEREIGIFVLEDAMRAVNIEQNDGTDAVKEMRAAGAVFVTADAVVNGNVIEVVR